MNIPDCSVASDTLIPSRLALIAALFAALLALVSLANCQTAESLSAARKIYVAEFNGGKAAEQLRASVIRRLQKSGRFQLADSPEAADAVLTGTGQVWIGGYLSTNWRAPSANRQPVYEGYLSVEIKGKDQRTLWSYLVTPSRSIWANITNDLAGSLVRNMVAAANSRSPLLTAPASELKAASLAGAGATFPAPLYRRWFESFEQRNPAVHITYDAVGSEKGAELLASHAVDFAASDVSSPDLGNPGLKANFRRIPTVLGAVVMIYNLPGVAELRFTPDVLAGIYLGQIKRWNDPEIVRWNKGTNLPDSEIVVVHRSDGSGTTYTFSDFLSKVSPEWQRSVGRGTTLSWPVGEGQQANDGVAAKVQATLYSIGYVELVYAIQHELNYGLVRNSSGEFIRANIESLAMAAKGASAATGVPPSITNSPAARAYPIATFTWLLLPQQIGDPAKKSALYDLLRWVLTDGQNECSALAYAPLPPHVAQRELEWLQDLK